MSKATLQYCTHGSKALIVISLTVRSVRMELCNMVKLTRRVIANEGRQGQTWNGPGQHQSPTPCLQPAWVLACSLLCQLRPFHVTRTTPGPPAEAWTPENPEGVLGKSAHPLHSMS